MDALESIPSTDTPNPCISCGACCAYYRCSFYWAEADCAPGGTVPFEMTEKLNDFRLSMRGMSGSTPRCAALLGEIGNSVRCSIYDLRSSVCRDFPFSWDGGIHNPRCDKARLAWGLPVLEPDSVPQNPETTDPPVRPFLPNAA